jgi:hypothetical protein
MNYIKVKDKMNKTVLVNLDLVSSFYGTSEDTTTICYGHPDEYISINVPIQKFEEIIENTIKSKVVEVVA